MNPMQTPLFDDQVRHLVRLAASVAGATIGVTRRVLTEARGGVAPELVDEVLLQSYLFAGFPRTLNAFAVWRELSGVAAPATDEHASAKRYGAVWPESGEAACRTVYGPVYDTLRDNVRALHPALDEWMVVDGYGKVLSRPALDLARRELCIVAACAATGQDRQLHSHLHGALNVGVDVATLRQAIDMLADGLGADRARAARLLLDRVIGK